MNVQQRYGERTKREVLSQTAWCMRRPAATETLNESTMPFIGILQCKSDDSRASSLIPLQKTISYLVVVHLRKINQSPSMQGNGIRSSAKTKSYKMENQEDKKETDYTPNIYTGSIC